MRGGRGLPGVLAFGLAAMLPALAIGGAGAAAGPLTGPLRAWQAASDPLYVAAADIQAGKEIFQSRCSTCHTLGAGQPNEFGPNLHGLFGRRAGSLPGYNYSSAMKQAGAAGLVWNETTLDAYLKDPHADIPGIKMPFPGIPSETQRQNLIAYLAQATK